MPFVAVLCDNAGFAVIHRLQTGQGADGFNNLLADSRGPGAGGGLRVDFAAHARSLGCHVEEVADGGPRRAAHGVPARARPPGASSARPSWSAGCATRVDRVGRLVGDRRAGLAVRPRGVRRGKARQVRWV